MLGAATLVWVAQSPTERFVCHAAQTDILSNAVSISHNFYQLLQRMIFVYPFTAIPALVTEYKNVPASDSIAK